MNSKKVLLYTMCMMYLMAGQAFFSFRSIKQKMVKKVTIFIHGTHRTGSVIGNVFPSAWIYTCHEKGLYKVEDCAATYCYTSVARCLNQYASDKFPLDEFYVFVWSGILSHEARIEAAWELHAILNNLVESSEDEIQLTLITHSHGGNVALNLATIRADKKYSVDTLIMLAPPVQNITQQYVDDVLFKQVFSIYSMWDLTQILDPQGLGQYRKSIRRAFTNSGQQLEDLEEVIPFFSQRKFHSQKVRHIQVKQAGSFYDRPIAHLEFLLPSFTWSVGKILDAAQEHDFSRGELVVKLERRSLWDFIKGV